MTNWLLMSLVLGEALLVLVAVAAIMLADWRRPEPQRVSARNRSRH